MARRPFLQRIPDPARAHGAWVYLIASILAGALTAVGRGFVPALLVGLGFAGVFLVASGVAVGVRRGRKRLVVGVVVTLGFPALALALGADPMFLAYAAVAVFPVAASAWFAARQGFQSVPALLFAVTALVLAAPSAACAGGTDHRLGLLLVALLVPFFAWRTWHVRRLLARRSFTRPELKAVGKREALYAGLWTVGAVVSMHALA